MQTVNRNIIVNVRLNETEQTLLTRLSEREQRKPAELLREALRSLGEARGLWPPTPMANGREVMRT